MRKLADGLKILVIFSALAFIFEFAVLASLRLVYPFELEWYEGAVVDEIRWIIQGNSIYIAPSRLFVPLVYDPLYFYLSAAVMKLVGIGYIAPRLVSILATLGCFVLLYLIVIQDSDYRLPGIIAAGTYAACYRFAGAWMDIARTDALFLCQILAAFYLTRRAQSGRMILFGGILYLLAYFTKQTALPIALGMALLSLVETRGRWWREWVIVGVVGLGIFEGLNRISDGWFAFYTIDALSHQAWVPNIWSFWDSMFRQFLPILIIVSSNVIFLGLDLASRRQTSSPTLLQNLGFGSGLVFVSWVIFFKIWTYDNGFLPACLGFALLAGWGSGHFLEPARQLLQNIHVTTLRVAIFVLILLQFALLYYNPFDQVPTEQDREAGYGLIQQVRNLPGNVWMFNDGFLSSLAGKQTFFTSFTWGDVNQSVSPPRSEDERRRAEQVKRAYTEAISSQAFDWVIVNKPNNNWLPYYVYVKPVFDHRAFFPVTGARSRPESIMIKNPVARGGNFPLESSTFDFLLPSGWSVAEDWGRWSIGTSAVMRVALESTHNYQIEANVFPYCGTKTSTDQVMRITWNGQRLGEYPFDSCDSQSVTLNVPSNIVEPELNTLQFDFKVAQSPFDFGLSDDRRNLAVGFSSLAFVQE